jgi:hypothetical protein
MHNKLFLCHGLCFSLLLPVCAQHPLVTMETAAGKIKLELYEDKAPVTVRNFLHYLNTHAYDGAEFYRVVTLDAKAGHSDYIAPVRLQFTYITK